MLNNGKSSIVEKSDGESSFVKISNGGYFIVNNVTGETKDLQLDKYHIISKGKNCLYLEKIGDTSPYTYVKVNAEDGIVKEFQFEDKVLGVKNDIFVLAGKNGDYYLYFDTAGKHRIELDSKISLDKPWNLYSFVGNTAIVQVKDKKLNSYKYSYRWYQINKKGKVINDLTGYFQDYAIIGKACVGQYNIIITSYFSKSSNSVTNKT